MPITEVRAIVAITFVVAFALGYFAGHGHWLWL
jgi:hypothetical protein